MKINKTNVKRSILFVLLGILISVVLITAFSWIVSDVSAKMTYEATLSVKKNMLYEYVNNFIIYLDGEIDQYLAAHPDADEAELEEAMLEIARQRIYEDEHFPHQLF